MQARDDKVEKGPDPAGLPGRGECGPQSGIKIEPQKTPKLTKPSGEKPFGNRRAEFTARTEGVVVIKKITISGQRHHTLDN